MQGGGRSQAEPGKWDRCGGDAKWTREGCAKNPGRGLCKAGSEQSRRPGSHTARGRRCANPSGGLQSLEGVGKSGRTSQGGATRMWSSARSRHVPGSGHANPGRAGRGRQGGPSGKGWGASLEAWPRTRRGCASWEAQGTRPGTPAPRGVWGSSPPVPSTLSSSKFSTLTFSSCPVRLAVGTGGE